jgi:hypothetical protein
VASTQPPPTQLATLTPQAHINTDNDVNPSIHQIASPRTNALAMWTTSSARRLSKLVVKWFATAENARKCHLIQFFILFVDMQGDDDDNVVIPNLN